MPNAPKVFPGQMYLFCVHLNGSQHKIPKGKIKDTMLKGLKDFVAFGYISKSEVLDCLKTIEFPEHSKDKEKVSVFDGDYPRWGRL